MNRLMDKKAKTVFLITLCSAMLIVHAFARFGTSFFKTEMSRTQDELEEMAESGIRETKEKYAGMISSLKTLAVAFNGFSSIYDESIYKQLIFFKDMTFFDHIVIADIDGNTVDSDGNKTNIKEREYFQKAINGETVISEIMDSRIIPDKEIQVIAVPIESENVVTGILFGILDTGTLNQEIGDLYLNHIYIQIVDSEGNYITRFKSEDAIMNHANVWDDLEEFEYQTGSLEELKEDISNEKEGHFTFRKGEEERVSYYAPLGVNNYYIFATTNSKNLKEHISNINLKVLGMATEMTAAFLILILGLYWYNGKVRKAILQSHEEVLSSEEMMRIAISQSKQTVFEYSVKTKELHAKVGEQNPLFQKTCLSNVPESILERNVIDEESADNLKETFELIKRKELCETEIKVLYHGEVQWFRMIMKNLYDEKHQIVNTVGILENISEKKYQEELLEEKQQIQDALNADAFLRCKIDLETEMVVEVDGKILKEQIPYQQYLKENILSVTGKEDWKNVICQSSKEYLIDEYQKGQDVIEIQFQMQYQGTERWVSCMIYLMTDNCRNGHIQALMILNDIDKRKREELRLKERAERDGLTGLYNATTMKMKADNFLQSLWALEGNHIFMLMDLDCFKQINDTFGHQYGDQVLKDVSQTLTKTFRHNDLIGRMGGDEFAIMILNVSDFSVIEHTVQQLLKELHKSYEQNGKTVEVSASLGIVTAPEHGTTFEELYQKSDQMLYEVKRSVKNGYRLYQEKESEHETDFNCR